MREHITGIRIATKIRMLRSVKCKISLVIVEGDTDRRLFGKFINEPKCEIVVAEKRENVIEAINILNEAKIYGYFGIVDLDFASVEGDIEDIPNLFLTDTHDIESMIIKSPSLENIISEFADKDKLVGFQKSKAKSLREVLIESTKPIGYFRWFSLRKNLGYSFKDIDFSKFINSNTLDIDNAKLITEVLNKSQKYNLREVNRIEKGIKQIISDKHDPWHLCCGHDMSQILLIGLKNIFGLHNTHNLKWKEFEGDLRLAYEFKFFSKSGLHSKIKEWESNSHGFLVISRDEMQKAV